MCNPFFLSALLKAVCDYKINHACNNLENKCDGCTYRTVVCEEAWESIFSCLFYLAKHENEILTADIFFPFLFQQKLNCSAKVFLHLTKWAYKQHLSLNMTSTAKQPFGALFDQGWTWHVPLGWVGTVFLKKISFEVAQTR